MGPNWIVDWATGWLQHPWTSPAAKAKAKSSRIAGDNKNLSSSYRHSLHSPQSASISISARNASNADHPPPKVIRKLEKCCRRFNFTNRCTLRRLLMAAQSGFVFFFVFFRAGIFRLFRPPPNTDRLCPTPTKQTSTNRREFFL